MFAVSSNSSHGVDTKTVKPALRQTVTAISTTNTPCTIFKWDSFDIKVHIVFKILALVLAIILLLNQQKNTFTFTASRSGGDSIRVHCVYNNNNKLARNIGTFKRVTSKHSLASFRRRTSKSHES